MEAKKIVVAIELGSSKITGVAGNKNPDGSISLLALVKEKSAGCIRKGTVYNIEKTVQCVNNIINELKKKLHTDIAQVYVGIGGQSLRSVNNTLRRDFDVEKVISEDVVSDLCNLNRATNYNDHIIQDTVVQEYKVDARYQLEPVGIACSNFESNYLNIITKKIFYRNLKNCFDSVGVNIAGRIIAPIALADVVLTDVEKNIGCVLVDMGYGTTTVSVYHKGLLRHLCVIPLGGNSITRDIASLLIEESTAEDLKQRFGRAYTKVKDVPAEDKISLDKDRFVEKKKFLSIVGSRVYEIIENIEHQIPKEYADKLAGGFILTGGASNMRDICDAFRNILKEDKVRIADYVNIDLKCKNVSVPHDGTMNTAIGLLAAGSLNCTRVEEAGGFTVVDSEGDKVTSNTDSSIELNNDVKPVDHNPIENPINDKPKEEEIQEEPVEDPKHHKNGRFKNFISGCKDFFTGMVSADDEDNDVEEEENK